MNTALGRKVPHHISVDAFIAWAPDDRWELIDGQPRAGGAGVRRTGSFRRTLLTRSPGACVMREADASP